MTDQRISARDKILDAAQRVAAAHGAGKITLGKVAEEAGISKGGLLYHFPSKEVLIQGMLERLIAATTRVREEASESLPEGPHATLRALLATRNREGLFDPDVVMAILAASAEQPELLNPLREHIATVREQIIAEGGDKAIYWLLWAATDGLLLQETLGIAPYPAEQRQMVRQKLLAVAEELLQ